MNFIFIKKVQILLLILLVFSTSCSRTNNEEEIVGALPPVSNELKPISPTGDEDGDRIENSKDENMFLADVPTFDKKFAQSLKMEITKAVSGSSTYVVENNVDQGDFDFEYGVGNHDFKVKSDVMIAKVAKFTQVAKGVLRDIDFEKISYPKTRKGKHLKGLREFLNKGYDYDSEGNDLSITFKSTLKLLPSDSFEEVRDITLGVYYFNYETNKEVKVATKRIERIFARDNQESFSVTLENLPNRILIENYFKHGEFVSVKIEDFTIPKYETTYKEFMAGVYEKTIPVGITTPLYNYVKFVSTSRHNNSIGKIIRTIFGDDHKIEENTITQLGEFANNSKGGDSLGELRGHKKTGKWYVLTNNTQYELFKHSFKRGDKIVFNFAIDHNVGSQVERTASLIKLNVDSGEHFKEFDLGEISKNSKLNLMFTGIEYEREEPWSREFTVVNKFFSHQSGNNMYFSWYKCDWREQKRSDDIRKHPLNFDRDTKSKNLEHIQLVVDDKVFSLSHVLENAEGLSYEWFEDALMFSISDIDSFKESLELDSNKMKIRISTIKREIYTGYKKLRGEGPHTDARATFCNPSTMYQAKPDLRPVYHQVPSKAVIDVIGHLDNYYN